jgi:regulator of sigma E protease
MFWILVGIGVLGVMVLFHECGHFLVAKLLRVRVLVFSIGFGPRLLGMKRGATDYRLSALPLGGYVRLAGDNPAEERAGARDEFLSQPRGHRALIVLAGPVTNILLAVAVLTGLYAYRYERPAFLDQPAVLAAVRPDSPAAEAGLEPGDRIVAFGSLRQPTWEQLLIESTLAESGPVRMEVERAGEILERELILPGITPEDPGQLGWVPDQRLMVETVQAQSPAERAGFRRGDLLLALGGSALRPTATGEIPLSEQVQRAGGQPLLLTIERHGERQDIPVTPVFGDHPEGKRWLIGVNVRAETVRQDLTLAQALGKAGEENLRMGGQMLTFLARLVTGRASMRGLQGPIGIVRYSGEAGEQGGWLAVLNLTVLISLSLGILNLLPIPILDGGHLAVLGVEAVRQRDLSLTLKERLTQVGLVFLLLVFAVVMYNDIVRIFFN